jgi:hypothetical protein
MDKFHLISKQTMHRRSTVTRPRSSIHFDTKEQDRAHRERILRESRNVPRTNAVVQLFGWRLDRTHSQTSASNQAIPSSTGDDCYSRPTGFTRNTHNLRFDSSGEITELEQGGVQQCTVKRNAGSIYCAKATENQKRARRSQPTGPNGLVTKIRKLRRQLSQEDSEFDPDLLDSRTRRSTCLCAYRP